MNSGSGTKSSEMLAELRVEQIISGDFGERARERLKKMNIKTLQWEDTRKSVREIIDKIS